MRLRDKGGSGHEREGMKGAPERGTDAGTRTWHRRELGVPESSKQVGQELRLDGGPGRDPRGLWDNQSLDITQKAGAAGRGRREQPFEGPGPGVRGPRIEWGELKGWVAQAAITTYHRRVA